MAGIHRREPVENIDKLIDQRLALDTEQQVFEVAISKIGRPAGVAPKLNSGNVCAFLAHTVLD